MIEPLTVSVAVIDRGYTARLERKVGGFPTHERKPRTIERVNDEIVASIIATVREAGLDAQPGSEDALKLSDDVLIIGGRLRPSDLAAVAKNKPAIFGTGRVTAASADAEPAASAATAALPRPADGRLNSCARAGFPPLARRH